MARSRRNRKTHASSYKSRQRQIPVSKRKHWASDRLACLKEGTPEYLSRAHKLNQEMWRGIHVTFTKMGA